MKSVAFLFVSAIASIAFAYPTVKDQSVFKGTYNGAAGGTIDFVQSLELVSYDATKDSFMMKNVFTVNGQVQSQDVEIAKANLPDLAKVQGILAQCEAGGGKLEDLTVPAGTFKTCHAPQQNKGEVWIADAPFGFVKEIYFDQEQNRIEVELSSFTLGQ